MMLMTIGPPRLSFAAILTAIVLLLPQSASAAEKVVLQLRWYHDFQFAGYYAALWQGYYAEAGLDVEIRDAFTEDGEYLSPIREVAEGRAEFGIAGSDILIGRDVGVPFTVVAPIFQESPITIFAKEETRLTSPADLKRLNLGMFTRGNVADAEVQEMLKSVGLDPETDFPRVTVTRRRLIDVVEGRVDAAVGYTTDMNWFEKQLGAKARQLKPSKFGVDFYGDSLFTRRAVADQAPNLVKAFREASLKGWRYALTHGNEVADSIARKLPHRQSIEDIGAFIRSEVEPVTRLTHFPADALGHNDIERWRRIHASLAAAGVVKGDPPSVDFVFDPVREERLHRRLTWIAVGVALLLGAILAIFTWITMLRRSVAARTRDLTESARRLRESEERFGAFFDNSPSAMTLKDIDGRFRVVNKRFEKWFGISQEEAFGKTSHELFPAEFVDDFVEQDRETIDRNALTEHEREIRLADESEHSIVVTKFPIFVGGDRPIGIGTIQSDVTEYRMVETQLRRAQKMEAVGQLTGGVAHEFNNLLMVIVGNLEMILDRVPDDPTRKLVNSAMRGAERGAELTDQLLAFSRKQNLRVEQLELNGLVLGMRDMIQRSLGETISVEIELAEDVWPVLADSGQLEGALLNLLLNSRDAMPRGGKIVIVTSNGRFGGRRLSEHPDVAPADYVVLEVADTGCGMAPEIQDRVFDPFFTTKDVGEGTGLGLSMVHGFVEQSGGFVEIDSEPGRGTKVRLYLPRAAGQVKSSNEHEHDPAPDMDATILVVEDDPGVRELVVGLLSGFGCGTVEAKDGETALACLDERSDISILFTDVVLPGGMSGPDIAKEARRRNPGLKVVFTSGYPDGEVDDFADDDGPPVFIRKPYRKSELADTLGKVLAGTV